MLYISYISKYVYIMIALYISYIHKYVELMIKHQFFKNKIT